MWSGRVLMKYWALQLPGTVLVIAVLLAVEDLLAWPQWLVWAVAVAWVGKDAILYPLVWRSYDAGAPARLPYPVDGTLGVAFERIAPRGHVRSAGELWRAELSPGARAIEAGETVRINGRRRFTLLVEPQAGGSALRPPLHDNVAEQRETHERDG